MTMTAWAVALGAAACSGSRPAENVVSDSTVVARVGNVAISAAAIAAQMRRQGIDGRRALEDLVDFEILADAARLANTPADGTDAALLRSTKVQRLIEREIEPGLTRHAIPEADVRGVYDKAKGRFVHGRLVEIAILCVFTGSRMKPELRGRLEDIAHRLKALIDGRPQRTAADFEAISKDPFWLERKVTFTTVFQGDSEPFPRVVGRAVQRLAHPGDTTDLVGDETGYYIARYVSEKPPKDIAFETAAPAIREDMYEPWRRRQFLRLVMDMSAGHDIEVFPENISHLADRATDER
jgi:hypothetical protein